MTAREIKDETEIFTEALGASVAQGNLTVDQLKRQLEGGLAYVEAQGADKVAEELLVALAALDKLLQRVTGPIYNLGPHPDRDINAAINIKRAGQYLLKTTGSDARKVTPTRYQRQR